MSLLFHWRISAEHMIKFLTSKTKTFGLDISDLSLKIIQLKKKGKFLSLASWGEKKIKPGIIEEGEIKNEEALFESIKESLTQIKGEKLKTKNVIVSLPEKKAFLQVIKMPKMKEEELKMAVPFEAENYIPLPIEKVYLDFQIIPSVRGYSDKHLDVLIAAIPQKTVDPYVFCLKKAGLSPLVLEVESQSISRALIKNGLSPFPVLLIDFGKSKTSFIIFSGYSLQFTSSIPISSQKLTEVISQYLKIDLVEAEKIKLKYGLEIFSRQIANKKKIIFKNRKEIDGKKISEALIPVLTDLAEQIKRYLDYYQTHANNGHFLSKNERVKKVLLCGRGANLKGLTDFLSFELKIPVELGNPWVNILPTSLREVPELPFKESLGYTTALGLALRGIINE